MGALVAIPSILLQISFVLAEGYGINEQDCMTLQQSDWPGASLMPKCLKPTRWGLGKFLLLYVLMAAFGALLAVHPRHPGDRVKAVLTGGLFGMLVIQGIYRARRGGFNLYLETQGLRIGKNYYPWADIRPGFSAGPGFGWAVNFTVAGKRTKLLNYYGMSTPAMAALLNNYLPQSMVSQNFSLQKGDYAGSVMIGRSKILPIWAWILIIIGIALVGTIIQPITLGFWQVLAPVNYAGKMLGDEDLSDRAGFEPDLLPVLLARAEAGDRSAMYFYGGLFDPENFAGETAVPKNAATAIAWYQRAVALGDQGAERNLAILYHTGIGVQRDDTMAASLFERAVAKNDDFGDYYLGTMLESGQGEPKNLPRAYQLEQASAAQGQALGQVELGRMYFYGIGVTPDRAKAAAAWKRAAAQGDTDAQNLLTQNGMQ